MKTNLNINLIGLGCVTFGREIDQKSSFEIMDYALEKGITLFDTAAAYSAGLSETIVGAWLASRKSGAEKVVLATKILPPFEPKALEMSVNESLRRLGVRTVDILFLHCWNPALENHEVLAVLEGLIQSGKAKTLGASNFSAGQLSNITTGFKNYGLSGFNFAQNNHNLAVSDISPAFKEVCIANDINMITYSPLGAGFLTGKHQKGVEPGSRFDRIPGHQDIYFNEHSDRRLQRLKQVALKTGHSTVYLALAWALHQKATSSVLIGARTKDHIDQALAAIEFNDPQIFSELENV
ncbi:MAG: aldo/keto reductase [Phormidesmis sp. FL-bin-119]|nr:aldo/keto reductase [Pedobacter sp.]